MATFRNTILIFGLTFFQLIITQATPEQRTGLLASLYNKAVQEKRPLILVLDNSLKQNPLTAQPLEFTTRQPYYVKKQTPSFSSNNVQKLPYLLLQNLKIQNKRPSKFGFNALNREPKQLPFQFHRISLQDNSYNRDEYHSLRILIKKEKPGARTRNGIDGQALRNSIALNVLRQSNGACDLKDDCDPKEYTCEVKIQCKEVPQVEEMKPDQEECRFSETCAEDDKQISTKGVVENF